jgi:hypothetical protein
MEESRVEESKVKRENGPLPWGEGVPLRRFYQPERDG